MARLLYRTLGERPHSGRAFEQLAPLALAILHSAALYTHRTYAYSGDGPYRRRGGGGGGGRRGWKLNAQSAVTN